MGETQAVPSDTGGKQAGGPSLAFWKTVWWSRGPVFLALTRMSPLSLVVTSDNIMIINI